MDGRHGPMCGLLSPINLLHPPMMNIEGQLISNLEFLLFSFSFFSLFGKWSCLALKSL